MGFGQFGPYILSFQKKTNTVRAGQGIGIVQQPGQGSQRPGCHHIIRLGDQILDPGVFYGDVQAHAFCGGSQEHTFLGAGFVQGHRQLRPHRRQHQPRKARAAAQIGQGTGRGGDQGGQLGAVPDMPPPDFGQAGLRHQIVAAVPISQHIGIGL